MSEHNHAVKNDRKNHLGNAQKYLRLVVKIGSRINDINAQEIADQDVRQLLNLSDQCSNTLRRYINVRNQRHKDKMLEKVKLSNSLHTTSDHRSEINWLSRFGRCCEEKCIRFIEGNFTEGNPEINIDSIQEFYERLVDFRQRFGQIYNPLDIDHDSIRENYRQYFDAVLDIAIGTGLVCEDGIKYYSDTNFSTDSIWLGSRIFLTGANNLLEI